MTADALQEPAGDCVPITPHRACMGVFHALPPSAVDHAMPALYDCVEAACFQFGNHQHEYWGRIPSFRADTIPCILPILCISIHRSMLPASAFHVTCYRFCTALQHCSPSASHDKCITSDVLLNPRTACHAPSEKSDTALCSLLQSGVTSSLPVGFRMLVSHAA